MKLINKISYNKQRPTSSKDLNFFKSENNKETAQIVNDWIKNIKRLRITFKYLYNTEHSHEFNGNFVTIKKLATPTGFVSGFNLLCMIDHDITVSNFIDAKHFLDPNSSQTGYVLCDMISRSKAWEKSRYKNYKVEDAKKLYWENFFR